MNRVPTHETWLQVTTRLSRCWCCVGIQVKNLLFMTILVTDVGWTSFRVMYKNVVMTRNLVVSQMKRSTKASRVTLRTRSDTIRLATQPVKKRSRYTCILHRFNSAESGIRKAPKSVHSHLLQTTLSMGRFYRDQSDESELKSYAFQYVHASSSQDKK